MSDHTTTTAVVATTAIAQWQPSAATTEVMPPAASPEGALIAAHVLLHNPLGPDASPEVAEQWRNDVDHLIVDVINTPPHRRQRTHHSDGSPEPSPVLLCTPMAACTPSTTRIPTAASLTTIDLRAEFEHRCSGEDGCTTIERQGERRRNLDDRYGTTNAAPTGHAVHTPTSPGAGGGCVALSPHIRMVVWCNIPYFRNPN
jgi:hypothetical protein